MQDLSPSPLISLSHCLLSALSARRDSSCWISEDVGCLKTVYKTTFSPEGLALQQPEEPGTHGCSLTEGQGDEKGLGSPCSAHCAQRVLGHAGTCVHVHSLGRALRVRQAVCDSLLLQTAHLSRGWAGSPCSPLSHGPAIPKPASKMLQHALRWPHLDGLHQPQGVLLRALWRMSHSKFTRALQQPALKQSCAFGGNGDGPTQAGKLWRQ